MVCMDFNGVKNKGSLVLICISMKVWQFNFGEYSVKSSEPKIKNTSANCSCFWAYAVVDVINTVLPLSFFLWEGGLSIFA